MYGELTDKDTVLAIEEALDRQEQMQVEMLLYKKNSKHYTNVFYKYLLSMPAFVSTVREMISSPHL